MGNSRYMDVLNHKLGDIAIFFDKYFWLLYWSHILSLLLHLLQLKLQLLNLQLFVFNFQFLLFEFVTSEAIWNCLSEEVQKENSSEYHNEPIYEPVFFVLEVSEPIPFHFFLLTPPTLLSRSLWRKQVQLKVLNLISYGWKYSVLSRVE